LPIRYRNAATAPIVWTLAAFPALWAVVFSANTQMLVVGFGLAALGYSALYGRLFRFSWKFGLVTVWGRESKQ
jgi:hypothetical protein